jgi:type II secretory pathway component PulK
LWGSQRVNVNTAPRQVLEAALTFGGDPVELVEKIIQKRKEAPIKSIDELKETFYSDSLMIDRAKDYLTTTSNFFLIRVVSHSGNARVSATATVIKEGRTVERLAILYGL